MPVAPPIVCRFAPSPNGPLHLGHAYSALRNRAVAEEAGGHLLLRMEDIDVERCPPIYEAAIREDLDWLGLRWHGPVRRQSRHFPLYTAALDKLAERQLVYPCFCTRGDIAAATRGRAGWPCDPDGAPLYPGICRRLDPTVVRDRQQADRPFCRRLDMDRAMAAVATPLGWWDFHESRTGLPIEAVPQAWGDAVLRRKDNPASYHIAVVVDDAEQGVTDVVRGRDLFAATALHRLLQVLLGYPEPRYHHHRLVLDEAGLKLSKSRMSAPLSRLRRDGASPQDIARLIADRLDPCGG